MSVINYISSITIPFVIFGVCLYGLIERKNVFDIFLEGAKEGFSIVINILPTLVGIFLAVGALRSSGVLELIINFLSSIISFLGIPKEIMPLALLRPISGSASLGVATDIMKNYGVDSKIGMIASTIMGSTETTFYTIAVYTAAVKVKKTRFILIAALTADIVGMLVAVVVCRFLSTSFC